MDKKFWKFAWLASLLCLLPLVAGFLLWEQLPAQMANHWNIAGQADGWADKLWVVTSLPLMMFGGEWLMVGGLFLDRRNVGQNPKLIRVLLMLFPVISNVMGLLLYATAMEYPLSMPSVSGWMFALLGLLFVAMGNYLPKCRQNATLGIKLPWTLYNEENWNRTHRFGGKVYFWGGLAMMLLSLLPLEAGLTGLLAVIVALAVLPTVYSWRLYKQQVAQGRWTQSAGSVRCSPKVKKLRRLGWCVVAVVCGMIFVVCFTGNISVVFQETAFVIDAAFSNDLTVDYAGIDSAELLPEGVPGVRVWGFGSPRLACGTFENETLGIYTRYTYTGCKSAILLTKDGKALVINGATPEETRQLYETILTHIP